MTLITSDLHHTSAEADATDERMLTSLQESAPAPLLEYHADTDPDIHYIPKVTACFAAGALTMGIILNMVAVLILNHNAKPEDMVYQMVLRMAFVIGIAGVGGSLLLVGLKFRDDHSANILFARHWLNSLGTGAAFSMVVWGPWLIAERGVDFNRFAAAGVWMCLMALPGVASLWVVGPKRYVTVQKP